MFWATWTLWEAQYNSSLVLDEEYIAQSSAKTAEQSQEQPESNCVMDSTARAACDHATHTASVTVSLGHSARSAQSTTSVLMQKRWAAFQFSLT